MEAADRPLAFSPGRSASVPGSLDKKRGGGGWEDAILCLIKDDIFFPIVWSNELDTCFFISQLGG
jgi:hypothetical protein